MINRPCHIIRLIQSNLRWGPNVENINVENDLERININVKIN